LDIPNAEVRVGLERILQILSDWRPRNHQTWCIVLYKDAYYRGLENGEINTIPDSRWHWMIATQNSVRRDGIVKVKYH
jgi:hypothetical protein